jgi:glutamine amidotransferase
VSFERSSPLTEGLPEHGSPFYHVHSLVARPDDPNVVVASTEYGERFATIVASGSIYGVQFHPEKSSRHGLRMLANFTAICRGAPVAVPRPAAARA